MIPIVTLGAHGLLAPPLVMVVRPLENVFALSPLKVFVSRQKIKTVEWRPAHQIPVHHVLVQMANGLNGDSALKHVAAEFKTDFECCVVQTAIPKNKLGYAQRIRVPAEHVTIVVTVGHLGVIAVQNVVELKLGPVHVVYM